MNQTVVTIIFIMAASTLFPMVGYFLDRRHRKKMMTDTDHKKSQDNQKG